MAGAVHLENSWILSFQNRIYFAYPGVHGDYTICHDWEDGYIDGTSFKFTTTDDTNESEDCYTWEADTSETTYDYTTVRTCPDDFPRQMLVMNLDTKRTTYYTFHAEMRAATVDSTNNRLIIGDDFGWVWHFEDPNETTDGGETVSWEVESKEFTLQTRAHFPRWVKYDVNADDDDCVATGTLKLDGTTHQTHTLTGDRLTKRRLVTTGNGKRCSINISGTGPVKIYAAETE
jgi:hypothetical protein